MISSLEKLTTDRRMGWDPRAERAGVGGPLAMGGRGVTLCVKNQGNGYEVIDLRLVVRQYSGNVARKMLFGVRHFGKGSEDGYGPGFEEIEHVDSLFTVVTHLYAFALSDYVPWLRFLDLEGHEKVVSGAMRNISKYNDSFVDQRLKKWRSGKMKAPQDFLDMFILAKDTNGKPALSTKRSKHK
ncbi:cytochrome p450 79a2 [Raphanus sativus]|nr:cytochrome p450 79a2 [Raphanus sativus]